MRLFLRGSLFAGVDCAILCDMEKKWQLWAGIAGAALVSAIFIYSCLTGTGTVLGLIVGGVMAALFAALFVMLCARPFAALKSGELSPDDLLGARNLRRSKRHPWGEIALFVLIMRMATLLVGYFLYRYGKEYPGGMWNTLAAVWEHSDSPSYLGIAERWYVTEGDPRFHIVFFPLYPCVIWLFNLLINNTLVSAMAVSAVASVIAAIFVYEAAAVDMEREAALRAVKYLFIFPAAFFLTAPMTEALFIMLSAAAIYFTRKKQYLWACIFGALSGFTRSVGGLIMVFIAWEIAEDFITSYRMGKLREEKRMLILNALCLLIVPLGLLGYLYINYSVTGDAFTFMRYQKEHWSQGFGLFFESAATQADYAARAAQTGNANQLWSLWIPNLAASIASLVLMLIGSKRLRPSYRVYYLAYFAVSCGATWLLSSPRYLTACVPLCFAAAEITDEKRSDIAMTVILLLLQAVYLYMYVNGMSVY